MYILYFLPSFLLSFHYYLPPFLSSLPPSMQADRMYIRDTLKRLLEDSDTKDGDGMQFAMREITLFAPVILLDQEVAWRDVAGSGDDDPVKYTNLVQELEALGVHPVAHPRGVDAVFASTTFHDDTHLVTDCAPTSCEVSNQL